MQEVVPPVAHSTATHANQRRNSKAIALVVPIVVLLLMQWPLRAWVEAFSNYVFNVTQILFGLYAAFAISAASRANTHLAFVQYGGKKNGQANSQWRAWARLLCVTPWAVLILYTALPQTLESVLHLEQFREGGFAHGFFLLRLTVVLLVALVLLNAIGDVYHIRRRLRQPQP